MKAEPRHYRRWMDAAGLPGYRVVVRETDLQIHSTRPSPELARETVRTVRGHLEAYIQRHPGFLDAMAPWPDTGPAPHLVRSMIGAGRCCGVGPMAAVAGAVAEAVGRALLGTGPEMIVENGGDVFLRTRRPAVVGLYAGQSPLSRKVGLRVDTGDGPLAVCTSSGRLGHSRSLGRADAACIVAADGALADAAATATGNRVRSPADIAAGVEFARGIPGVSGVVVVCDDRIGVWGQVELVPLP